MKHNHGPLLIVLGAILVLAPVVSQGISSARAQEHIAEFYRRNSNAAVLPGDLRPPGYANYDWACFGIGAYMASIGISRAAKAASAKPEPWAAAEV